MKNKILKILENPQRVISATFLFFLLIGFFIYKFVGYAPKVEINKKILSSTNDYQITGGETINLAFPKTGRISNVYVKKGDVVKKGQILANLDYTDASGALEIAKANYQKIINGATSADINVVKANVETAKINFESVLKQQKLATELAYRNLLNSNVEAVPIASEYNDYVAPTISGNYILEKEGEIKLKLYYSSGGISFSASGLTTGVGMGNTITPEPIGDSGLNIKFPSSKNINIDEWVIKIPNKKASNYLQNYNAYQSALETQKRLTDLAKANLDQANSALLLKISNSRPEDVSSAQGAISVAQGAYNNNFIYAPADGVIESVNLGVGEIILANQGMISMIVQKL